MNKERFFFVAFLLFLIIYPSSKVFTQESEVTVKNIGWGKVDIGGFSLSEDSNVDIEGTCIAFNKNRSSETAYAWILNSDNRKVVWRLLDEDEFDDNRGIFDFDKTINLEKGNYEIYYTFTGYSYNDNYDFGDLLNDIFTLGRRYRHHDRDYEGKLYMTVKGPDNVFKSNSGCEIVDQKSKDAVVSIIRTRDNRNIKKGFTLSGSTKLRIYALGEARGESSFDYGWITDVKTNKRVWVMNSDNTEHAGGGRKNVYVNKVIELPAGSYMVHYITDDSHSFREWNVMPPFDPQFWGITIWADSKEDYAKVKPFRKEDELKPIIELTKVRDDENLSKGFSLPKAMDLRILCLGEASGREMADYGWIINADTRENVWRMEKDKTENAGGAEKNRLTDQVVHFDKGDYIVYYSTDDSHSFNNWNSDPPYDPEQWGITIWTADANDYNKVKTFSEDDFKNKNIIAQIVKVRDDRHIEKNFSMDKEGKIRIYAIGEGTDHDMDDYGWIENSEAGKVVWEMSYGTTEHAGGARKNRMFNGTIYLPKGNYTLHYETDDSHSYRDWNDDPPNDPDMYGITVYTQ